MDRMETTSTSKTLKTEKRGAEKRRTRNYSEARRGGDLGPKGYRKLGCGGQGKAGIAASPVAVMTITGGAASAVTAVCCAKAQTAQLPGECPPSRQAPHWWCAASTCPARNASNSATDSVARHRSLKTTLPLP
jgi:hypothetical protein